MPISPFNMRLSIFSLVLVLVTINSLANHVKDSFIHCLYNRSKPTFPITGAIFTVDDSSFPSVLQAYIRNPRFNTSTTTKPLLIITPTHVSHIQAAITCLRTHGLQMRIRSGGHDYEGLSYVSLDETPFFILDMFRLRSVNVNIRQETAWAQTGATFGEVYYRISEKSNVHGLHGGVCPTVAIGGHGSGAGYGNMLRKYGLTVDNILDAQLVDVNGKLMDRLAMGEDLFWAITGGGGSSFGVILAFKFKLVRVPPTVTYFNVQRTSEENITNIAYTWLRIANRLDNDLFILMKFDVINTKRGKKTIRASFPSLFLGNSKRLLSIMNHNFPQLGLQKSDCIEMSWVKSTLVYAEFPVGTPIETLLSRTQLTEGLGRFKRKSDYLKTPISKQGLASIFKKMKELESQMISFNPLGGRMNEISEFAKPYPHRAGNIALIQYETFWDEPGDKAANQYINFTRVMHAHMSPFVSKNPREANLNYRDLDIGVNHNGKNNYLEGMVYGFKYFKRTNYNRLVRVKTKVDPDNFFRNEQGIPTLPSY